MITKIAINLIVMILAIALIISPASLEAAGEPTTQYQNETVLLQPGDQPEEPPEAEPPPEDSPPAEDRSKETSDPDKTNDADQPPETIEQASSPEDNGESEEETLPETTPAETTEPPETSLPPETEEPSESPPAPDKTTVEPSDTSTPIGPPGESPGSIENSSPTETVRPDLTVLPSATFAITEYNLTVNIDGNGTVTINPDKDTHQNGDKVKLTAEAETGWIFSGWSGDATGPGNPVTITMDGDKHITAIFIAATVLEVVTKEATKVEPTTASLNGELTSLGGFSEVEVFFEWGETESYGNTTERIRLTYPGVFGTDLKDLQPGITYHYRAKVDIAGHIYSGLDKQFTTGNTGSSEPIDKLSVETREARHITLNTAQLIGELIDLGNASSVRVYFEWGETDAYGNTTLGNKVTRKGLFGEKIDGLKTGVTYHFRAVARAKDRTVRGKDMIFTPTLTDLVVETDYAELGINQATIYGNLTGLGFAPGVQVYFEWGETANYGHSTERQNMNNIGGFFYDLNDLTENTTYHYRAVAVGDKTVYGEDRTFTPCAVSTRDATDCTDTEATLNGWLPDLNFYAEPPVCFEWGTDTNYGHTTEPSISFPGDFQAHITGLTPGATYHYRAKVDIAGRIYYGLDKQFTTESVSSAELAVTTKDVAASINGATLYGELTGLGSQVPVKVYFEWGETTDYGNRTESQDMNVEGSFNADLKDLKADTSYHFRAVAEGYKTVKGEDKSFTTSYILTEDATAIKETSATLNGELNDLPYLDSPLVSFEWGEDTRYGQTTEPVLKAGPFQANLKDLTPGTVYHYRAKADFDGTIYYGKDKQFKTLMPSSGSPTKPPIKPSVATRDATEIAATSAILNSEITSLGNASDLQISFEWGKASKKYTYQTIPQIMKSKGKYSYNLTGLSADMRYYFRIKAVDVRSKAVVYGMEKSFTTKSPALSKPLPPKGDNDRTIINTYNFATNVDVEVNIYNIIINNIRLKTADEKVILYIPGNTHLQDIEGKVPESFTVNVLLIPIGTPSEGTILQAYEFGPEGTAFDPPVTLTLKYDTENLPPGAKETDLTIAAWDGTRWSTIESQVDTLLKTVSAKISKFGRYALLASIMVTRSAQFNCSGLTIAPEKVQPDEPVDIRVEVSNTGSIKDTVAVILKINDNDMESREISLDAGQSETVTFQAQESEPGEYMVDVNGNNARFTVEGMSASDETSVATLPTEASKTPSDPGVTSSQASPPVSTDGNGILPVMWIIIASLVVIGAVVGLVLGRKRPPG